MSRTYYLRHGNDVRGPVTTQQLRLMAADGTLHKSDYIRAVDQDKWYVASAVKGLFPPTVQPFEPAPPRGPAPRKLSDPVAVPPTDSRIDIEEFERDQKRRSAQRRKRLALWAGATAGIAIISLAVALLVDRGTPTQESDKARTEPAQGGMVSDVVSEYDDPTYQQWEEVLSACHPDPDYILTHDDVMKAIAIYNLWKKVPAFAANRKRMFNIVSGCYYWNRDKTPEEWKSMFITKWVPNWDEPTHCKRAEDSRKREIQRRRKNAKYVRKSTKTPPDTGAFTRQEVYDACRDSTAQIDIESEITVAVDYREDLRGNLRSAGEVKEMMCEATCDFEPGDPDRCCECESAIVDFVFHQKGWE